ncbi:fasting-inducible integral membrane protein tm6p1-related [Anaeramoeba flamelloides]|uniref:Fasting-inducible integral membrane protein tm6p1-related n=1 Tax=Anaeramoeba flamelloides TaxID=1746091 RepID=A0AAV8A6D0_9EUKA|nr:fasting-inducible integral membrane protein tm6p1-related [Anaeramoeba flamelloides]
MNTGNQNQLTHIKVNHILNLALTIAVSALVISQIFARSLGHVDVPIPFHSLCENHYPEYFVSSSLLTVTGVLVLWSQHLFYKRQMYLYQKDKKLHRAMYVVFAIAILGFSFQAIFPIQQDWPSDREIDPKTPKVVWHTYLHFIFAGIFFYFTCLHFLLYIVFMIKNGFHKKSYKDSHSTNNFVINENENDNDHENDNDNINENENGNGKKDFNCKRFWKFVILFIFLIICVILSMTLQRVQTSNKKSRLILVSFAALFQYLSIVTIITYFWLFNTLLRNVSLVVIFQNNNNKNNSGLIGNSDSMDIEEQELSEHSSSSEELYLD